MIEKFKNHHCSFILMSRQYGSKEWYGQNVALVHLIWKQDKRRSENGVGMRFRDSLGAITRPS